MTLGETLTKLRLYGEPRGLLVTVRANLGELSPERVFISLKKKRPRGWNDSHFEFGSMISGDRRLLEHRLSSQVLKMTGEEIATARHLIAVIGDWLDGKSSAPRIDIPTENARIQIEMRGVAVTALTGLKQMHSLEVLSAMHLGPVYLEGRPRGPAVRWLPPVDSTDTTSCTSELSLIRNAIGEEYFAVVTDQLRQLRVIFAKKADQRRAILRKKADEMLGNGADAWLEKGSSYHPTPLQSVDNNLHFQRALAELNELRDHPQRENASKIRSWRA